MSKNVISSGGVVTKIENGKIKICLVKLTHTLTEKCFVFPKGHIEKDESFEIAALREVKEETGLQGLEIIKKLGIVTRKSIERDGTEVNKDIHLYLLKTKDLRHRKHDEEFEWLTLEEAIDKMMSQEEIDFLKLHWVEIGATI